MNAPRLDDVACDWQPDEVTCTPVEKIAYWAAVTVAACLTGGTVAGVAAYVYGRFFLTHSSENPQP